MRRCIFVLSAASAALAAGCGSDEHPHDDGESYNCEAEDRDDDFVIGIAKPGAQNQLTFKLMSAMPAPPSRGDNTWLLQLDTASGPMADAEIAVTPFMPDHQHGTPIEVKIEAMPTAGQYTLSPINLWMPGLWETSISATNGSDVDDVAVFRFCIPS